MTTEFELPGTPCTTISLIQSLQTTWRRLRQKLPIDVPLKEEPRIGTVTSRQAFHVFPGTVIASIERKWLEFLTLYPYVASVKTNGVHYFASPMMIEHQPGCVFINRAGQIFWTHDLPEFPSSFTDGGKWGTWWDGEWVLLRNGEYQYQIFDALTVNGQPLYEHDYLVRKNVTQLQLESWRWFLLGRGHADPMDDSWWSTHSISSSSSSSSLSSSSTDKTETSGFLFTAENQSVWMKSQPPWTLRHALRMSKKWTLRVKEVVQVQHTRWYVTQYMSQLPFNQDGLVLMRWTDSYISGQALHSFKFKETHQITVDYGCCCMTWEDVQSHTPGIHLEFPLPRSSSEWADTQPVGVLWTFGSSSTVMSSSSSSSSSSSLPVFCTICPLPSQWNVQWKKELKAVDVSNTLQPHFSTLQSCIMECRYDYDDQAWIPVQVRTDKPNPNSWKNIQKTCRNLVEHLTYKDMFEATASSTGKIPTSGIFPLLNLATPRQYCMALSDSAVSKEDNVKTASTRIYKHW